MRSFAWGVGALGLVLLCYAGCQGGGSARAVRDGSTNSMGTGSSDGGGMSTAGMVPDASGSPRLCSDLFDQTVVPAYSIEITADNWAKLDADFHDLKDVLAGTPPQTYYPVVFHYGSETVSNAAVRLRGKSSWVDTVMFDANPKMQFDVSFDQIDSKGKFHGVSSIHLTMPRDDWTFMNDRVGNNWLREIGLAAPCANNATFTVNGAYYGLYIAEGSVGTALLKQFFPGNSSGDLFKGGTEAETNAATVELAAAAGAPRARPTSATLQGLVDLPNTVLEWAAEAVVDDADGYYGGSHNYYIYDQGHAGYVWIPDHTDSALEWLEVFDPAVSYKEHPLYWWAGRVAPDPPGTDYLIVINDPTWRGHYVDAIATQVAKWDPTQIAAGPTPGRRRSPTRWPPIRTSGRRPPSRRRRWPRCRTSSRTARSTCRASSAASRGTRPTHRRGRRRRPLVQRLRRLESGGAPRRARDLRQPHRRQLQRRRRRELPRRGARLSRPARRRAARRAEPPSADGGTKG